MNKLRFVVIPLLLLLVIGCENSVQTMLDDYNSNFTVTHAVDDGSAPVPGDPDFVAEDMLFTEYYIASDDTLNLCAPLKCNSYRWVVTDPDENVPEGSSPTEIDVVMFEDRDKVSREFITYIPNSGLVAGKTYKLTLTVVGTADRKTYTDTAGLVVYKHYEFSNSE